MQKPLINMGFFKTIKIVYGSLIIGVILFLFAVVYLSKGVAFRTLDVTKFQYIIPIAFFLVVLINEFVFRKVFFKTTKSSELTKKSAIYQQENIVRGALFEAVGLLSIVATFITTNNFYLIFAIGALLFTIFYFSNKYKFTQAVTLSL